MILVSPERYVQLCEKDNLQHEPLEKLKVMANNNGMCGVCRFEPVWKLANTGMCFSCTTGEADNSNDYELLGELESCPK